MDEKKWSSFTKRIPVRASIENVFRAWATQQGLESWFLRKAEFTKSDNTLRNREELVQQGDTFLWLWHGYPDNVNEKREVISTNGTDKLQFTFSGGCLVTISLSKAEDFTICELKQENIPLNENPVTNLYIGCGEGWTFYLANLKSILEGGIDLRNKSLTLTQVINS